MSHGPPWGSGVDVDVPIGTLLSTAGFTAFRLSDYGALRECMWSKSLLVLKGLVVLYWVWVAKVLLLGEPVGFDAIIALSAPLFLSFHFLQALLVLRRIKSEQPFGLQLAQTLVFGALYLAPLLLEQSSRPQSRGAKPGRN